MRFRAYREAILHARNEREVEIIVRGAIGTLTPEELDVLPEECRKLLFQSNVDIHTVAVELLQCDLRHRGERETGDLTRQIAELYAWASVRVSALAHTHPAVPT
jgi:hypothetical protein